MEFAIIASIAMIGYYQAQGGAETRRSKDEPKRRLPRADAYPFQGGQDVAKRVRRYEDRAGKRWQQSLAPHMTGIVSPNMARYATQMQPHNNMRPFFRSARTQHAAPEQASQRRMEMFTGATDMDTSMTGTYRHKIEVQLAHPTNAMPVSSSGTSGNSTSVPQMDRYVGGMRHNNVSPVPQIRVGPGLGLAADAPATDGFHPMLRVLPVNIGEYTRNNLPGAVNHGGARNANGANGTVRPKFVKNRPDKPMATACNRQMERERAAVTAPTVRSDEGRDAVGRLAGHLYFGGAASGPSTGVQAATTVHNIAEGRIKPDTYYSTPAMNLGNEAQGVGGFVGAHVDPHRIDSQQRETPGGFGFLQAQGPGARVSAAGHLLPATQRDMNRLDAMQHLNPTPPTQNTQTRPMHVPATTLRESVLRGQEAMNLSVAHKASTMDNETRAYDLDREAKRASQVQGHTPLPGRTNVFEVASMGVTRVRDDDTAACAPNHGIARSTTRYGEALGELTTSYNKLPPLNPHLDQLDVARQQLRGNDLAIGPLLT